ncbi:MAG: hypothetical protein O3C25_02930 [Chloroflexi bacterium]|nr:hypothetical protein [Chloroflexota bacterium]
MARQLGSEHKTGGVDEQMDEMTHEERRFGDVLDAPAQAAALDPREDPELVELVGLARSLVETATAMRPRAGFVRHSRAMLMETMEMRRPTPAAPRRRFRLLQGFAVAPIAAAAALGAVYLLGGGFPSGGPAEGPETALQPSSVPAAATASVAPAAENLTALSIDQQIARLRTAADALSAAAIAGEAPPSAVLRLLSEGSAQVARSIEAQPENISSDRVVSYITAAADARSSLEKVEATPGNEAALDAARASAQDGVVVASRYFLDSAAGAAATPETGDEAGEP